MYKVNHATSNGLFIATAASFLGFAAALFSGAEPSKKSTVETPTATAPTQGHNFHLPDVLMGISFGLAASAAATRVQENKQAQREIALIRGLGHN